VRDPSSRRGSHIKTASAGHQLQPADLSAVCPALGYVDGSARHIAAFEAIGGIPHEILYHRMKTVVIGEAGGGIVYNRALIDFARHYGFQLKACRPYRAKAKGKVGAALSLYPRGLLHRPLAAQSRRPERPAAALA
jgi:hypothetical protein